MTTADGKRAKRPREEWERLVRDYEQGAQSRKVFCAQRSIPLSSFDYWRSKLRREGSANGFIELTPTAAPGWEVELALGEGVVLRLRRR